MAKTKKSPAKSSKASSTAKKATVPTSKASAKTAAKAPAAGNKPSAKASSKGKAEPMISFASPIKVVKAKPGERLEIPAPDFQEWWDNLKAFAYKSPATLVVGIIAVWMALVLLFD